MRPGHQLIQQKPSHTLRNRAKTIQLTEAMLHFQAEDAEEREEEAAAAGGGVAES